MTSPLLSDPSGFPIRWSEALAERYRAEGFWQKSTLVDVARAAVAEDPERVLLIEGERSLTRGDAWDQALRLASFFLARGLRPGDVVSFQLPNWIEASIIAFATRMIGLVVNPIPPIYRESELSYILNDCSAKMIFVPETFRKHDHRAMLEGLRANLPALRDIVVVRGGGELAWADAMALPLVPDADLPAVDPAAIMMVMYTSGTTGKPKGVLHTHYGYDYRVRSMGEAWSVSADDIIFMPSPVTHITGAYWAIDMPWVRGATSVLVDVWEPESGLRLIAEKACTIVGGATPFLQQLLDAADKQSDALPMPRLFFCGGTTVSPDLIKQASERFPTCLFFRAYGSTEMPTATLGIRDPSQAWYGAETDGEIVYPSEIKIVEATGDAPVPDGEEGEILVRGPEGFVGYLHASDNDDNFDADGFFRMGDLGRRVYDKYLVITGRKKDIIIRSGENISPKEVEDALYLHPAIAEVAIVAMPSAMTGEKGCAFIIPRTGLSVDMAEIRRFLDEAGLARQKFPEHIVLVDDLPRVPSGKVKKDVLRIRARELAAAATAPA